jgi:hypothetical protein
VTGIAASVRAVIWTAEGIAELRRWITEVEPNRSIRNETRANLFLVPPRACGG